MSSPAKLRPAKAPVVVTANALRDGRVVWLDLRDGWTDRIADARVFPPDQAEAALAAGQSAERARRVVGAYTVEIVLRGGVPDPLKFRERLRITGPSVDAVPKPALPLAS